MYASKSLKEVLEVVLNSKVSSAEKLPSHVGRALCSFVLSIACSGDVRSHPMTRSDSVSQLCFRCLARSDRTALFCEMQLKWLLNAMWMQLILGSCFLASSCYLSLSKPSKVSQRTRRQILMNNHRF